MSLLTRLRRRQTIDEPTGSAYIHVPVPTEFAPPAIRDYVATWLNRRRLPADRLPQLADAFAQHLSNRLWAVVTLGDVHWHVADGEVTFDPDYSLYTPQGQIPAYSDRHGRVHLGLSALLAQAWELVQLADVARTTGADR